MSPPAPKPERHQVSVTWREISPVERDLYGLPYKGYMRIEWETPQGRFVTNNPSKVDLTPYDEIVDVMIDDMYRAYLGSDRVDTEE